MKQFQLEEMSGIFASGWYISSELNDTQRVGMQVSQKYNLFSLLSSVKSDL